MIFRSGSDNSSPPTPAYAGKTRSFSLPTCGITMCGGDGAPRLYMRALGARARGATRINGLLLSSIALSFVLFMLAFIMLRGVSGDRTTRRDKDEAER